MSRTYNFGTGIRFGGDGFVEVRAGGPWLEGGGPVC